MSIQCTYINSRVEKPPLSREQPSCGKKTTITALCYPHGDEAQKNAAKQSHVTEDCAMK